MADNSAILQLPVELLSRIARFAHQPAAHHHNHTAEWTLLAFRQTCKAFEAASFDIFLEVIPKELFCYVVRPSNNETLKWQTSQTRLIKHIQLVTLTVDLLEGSNDLNTISTAEAEGQHLSIAQYLDSKRLEADFYARGSTPLNITLLKSALQTLQALPNTPPLEILVELSEDIYLEHTDSQNMAPMLSDLMSAVPSQMLRGLRFEYVHCSDSSLLDLLQRSHDTLEEFEVDEVSLLASEPQWTEVLMELTNCTKLKLLVLGNMREECLGEDLLTQKRTRFRWEDSFSAYLPNRDQVADGLRQILEAGLCAKRSAEGFNNYYDSADDSS